MGPLVSNQAHRFASEFTLAVYPLMALYTVIPKNACSTLRYAVAHANGYVDGLDRVGWIHSNSHTFRASLEFVAMARTSFVVLRCPFRRLASAYLHKIVDGDIVVMGGNSLPVDLTFRQFVQLVCGQPHDARDQHWRNQTDFLLLHEYDHYFSVERFSDAIAALTALGLAVVDTRPALRHDNARLEMVTGQFTDVPASDLITLKSAGRRPDYQSLYDSYCISRVGEAYADDLLLYRDVCHEGDLLFS